LRFKTLTEQALWFFSAGMALFFCGVLNIILIQNQRDFQIKILTMISNLVMTMFVIVFGTFTMKRNLENPMAWLLITNAISASIISLKMVWKR